MRKIMRLMLLGGLLVFIGCGEPNVQKTTQESITEDNTIVETPTEVSTSTTEETTEIKVDLPTKGEWKVHQEFCRCK